jgi:hypothetical protein
VDLLDRRGAGEIASLLLLLLLLPLIMLLMRRMWSLLLVWMLMRWMRRQRRANSDGEIPHQGREGGWGGARQRRSVR